jgi:hypothetical protein
MAKQRDTTAEAPKDRFLLCADNLADPRVVEYQFKDHGVVLERGTAVSLRYVAERFDAFKARRMEEAP